MKWPTVGENKMLMPNSEQTFGALRTLVAFLGGLAVARGWISADQMTQIGGAIVTLGILGWSIWSKRLTGQMKVLENTPGIRLAVDVSPGSAAPPAAQAAALDSARPNVVPNPGAAQ